MFRKTTVTEITGLTVSGASDKTGTWNVGIDLANFVSVPAGATGACFQVNHESYQGGFVGFRPTGGTAGNWIDPSNDSGSAMISAINGSLIDIYLADPNMRVFLVGFFDSDVSFFDLDNTPPVLDGAGGTVNNRLIPAGVTSGVKGVFVHAQTTIGNPETNTTLSSSSTAALAYMPVHNDMLRYVDYTGAPIVAEIKPDAVDNSAWDTPVTVVSDNTWRTAGVANPGMGAAVVAVVRGGTSHTVGFREKGTVVPAGFVPELIQSQKYNFFIVPLDANGEFEYITNGDGTEQIMVMAWLRGLPAAKATLAGDLVPGEEFTLNYEFFPAEPVSPVTIRAPERNGVTPAPITVPVTITNTDSGGVHSGTAVGTYPALPTSGTAQQLPFGSVDVELNT